MSELKTALVKQAWSGDESIDAKVNEWLDSHSYCKLFDIKYVINSYNTEEALIIYCEDSDVLAEVWNAVETFVIPQ